VIRYQLAREGCPTCHSRLAEERRYRIEGHHHVLIMEYKCGSTRLLPSVATLRACPVREDADTLPAEA
tara:strand:- start:2320 stop:2523 length:204 start_codon:yes stop_codon:yes gene_type:complete